MNSLTAFLAEKGQRVPPPPIGPRDRQRGGEHEEPDWFDRPDRRPRILIAEDDTEMRKLLAWWLTSAGYRVLEVATGTDLRHQLAAHLLRRPARRIDLLVSDIRLPGATGLDVLRSLRQFTDVPPAILITGFGDVETHAAAADLGVTLLDKPFDLDCLLARVRQLLAPGAGDE